MSIESVNRALAGDRLLFLALQTREDDPEPDDLRRIGTVGAIRQMAKVPTAACTSSSRAVARRADADAAGKRARDVAPLPETCERTLEVDAYVRRLQELIDRALSLASGLSQELRGAGRRHRRPAAAGVPAGEPPRHEGGRQAGALEENDLLEKLEAVARR